MVDKLAVNPEAAHRQRGDMKELSGKYMSGHLKMDWTSNVLIYPYTDPQSEGKSYWLKIFRYNHWAQLHRWGETPEKPCLKIKTIVCVCVFIWVATSTYIYMKCPHKANLQRQKAEGGSRNLMANRHEGIFCTNENFLNLDFCDSYKTVTSILKSSEWYPNSE